MDRDAGGLASMHWEAEPFGRMVPNLEVLAWAGAACFTLRTSAVDPRELAAGVAAEFRSLCRSGP
jgi:hypothetical protein